MDWKAQLTRAITSASSNMGVLRKDTFFTVHEIKATYGKKANEDFKSWFEASKHFDQLTGDKLYQELASGKLDETKFKKLLYSMAFSWVWTIKPEKQRKAWELSRGMAKLEEA